MNPAVVEVVLEGFFAIGLLGLAGLIGAAIARQVFWRRFLRDRRVQEQFEQAWLSRGRR